MDLLSVSGLVNFFGKVMDVDDISISPVLLQKGSTRLALYGLGSIRDERLNRSFQRGKVKMLQPEEDPDAWFNLLLFHQNRTPRGLNNYIPESYLDNFLHFILWGHEHECIINPQLNPEKDFVVCQAGSSVATSLSEGEAKRKHIALIEIQGTEYQFTPIPLQKVRPFIIRDICLKETSLLPGNDQKALNSYLTKELERILNENHEEMLAIQKVCPALARPLVRLRVDYSGGYSTINPQRFGQAFVDRVANAKDILLFYRKKISSNLLASSSKGSKPEIDKSLVSSKDPSEPIVVDDLITNFLEAQQLSVLPENEFGEAVRIFVDKDEKDAIQK